MPRAKKTVEFDIDCTGLDKAGLIKAIGEALQVPDWFGGNLDALFDILVDTETRRVINIGPWGETKIAAKDRRVFENVFEDAVEEMKESATPLKVRLVSKSFG